MYHGVATLCLCFRVHRRHNPGSVDLSGQGHGHHAIKVYRYFLAIFHRFQLFGQGTHPHIPGFFRGQQEAILLQLGNCAR